MKSITFGTIAALSIVFLTSCGSERGLQSRKTISPSATMKADAENDSPKVDFRNELQTKLDEACGYVIDAYQLPNGDFHTQGQELYAEAAKLFRPISLSYADASKFMRGALASAKEAHRWANGPSLYEGAQNQTFISEIDGSNILYVHDYCLAGGD